MLSEPCSELLAKHLLALGVMATARVPSMRRIQPLSGATPTDRSAKRTGEMRAARAPVKTRSAKQAAGYFSIQCRGRSDGDTDARKETLFPISSPDRHLAPIPRIPGRSLHQRWQRRGGRQDGHSRCARARSAAIGVDTNPPAAYLPAPTRRAILHDAFQHSCDRSRGKFVVTVAAPRFSTKRRPTVVIWARWPLARPWSHPCHPRQLGCCQSPTIHQLMEHRGPCGIAGKGCDLCKHGVTDHSFRSTTSCSHRSRIVHPMLRPSP